MNSPPVRQLLEKAVAGEIPAEEFETLKRGLRADAGLRREYLELVALDHLLVELYEVPAHVGLHARALGEDWGSRRGRFWQAAGSVAAALVLLLAAALVFLAIRANRPEIRIAGSADSRFAIDGEVRPGAAWRVGEELEVTTGAVSLALNPSVEACLEAPARVRLADGNGRLELIEGKAFFQIIPGGRRRDFWVATPAGIVRDIGTKFGLEVTPAGVAEVHVRQGIVEIDRQDGGRPHRVEAGAAARWSLEGPIGSPDFNPGKFLQSLPWDQVLFEENFEGEEGSPMSGREPPRGDAWRVWEEASPTVLGAGVFDTSEGARVVSAEFLREADPYRAGTYVIKLATVRPRNMGDKDAYSHARQSITFRDRQGEPVFSLGGEAEDDHLWELRGADGVGQPTGVPVFSQETLTLHYEKSSGQVLMFRGGAAEGRVAARAEASLAAVVLENTDGGDLALDGISVRLVSYPRRSGGDE